MKHSKPSLDARIRQMITLLSMILIVAVGFFVVDIREVRHEGMPHPRNPLRFIASGTHIISGENTPPRVEDIESWMTFSYINFAFGLPDDYLRDQMQIVSPKHPQISLRAYIKSQKLDPTLFVQEVKKQVKQYISTHPRP